MAKFEGEVTTGHVDLDGDILSPEVAFAGYKGEVPVSIEFLYDKVVGTAKLELREGKCFGVIKINDVPTAIIADAQFHSNHWFAVLGGEILEEHLQEGVLVMDKVKITEVSLTNVPANINLTPIKKVEDEN